MQLPQIYTSRYQNQEAIIASGLVPVRVTVGHPRFRLRYELKATIRELAPYPDMLKMTDPQPGSTRKRKF
jgi:hypothetical protein